MKIVAFLPAKGSSSRIESKNLKLLDGKPLFLYTLEKLMMCDFIDEVYLDTESEQIINLASETGCRILKRDPRLASNATDGNKLLLNEVNLVEGDIYIQILGTSPFISIETIEKGVNRLKDLNCSNDSVVLVRKDKLYTWDTDSPNYNLDEIPNSIDLPETIIETMGLYIIKRDAAFSTGRRIGNSPYLLEATPLESIDVNWPDDFTLANLIAAGLREKDCKLLCNIKSHCNSSLLSDILDDFGYKNQVIKGLVQNIDSVKLLGRAKTLKLRKLEKGEGVCGIYNALCSYDTVVPNDIIVVENSEQDFAYFGELNANLAIRSGASGVILNCKTRDHWAVNALNFPVFSSGYTCQDVRGRATTDCLNKRINIQGVVVCPGDLIFADSEGVVVVPKVIERKVISEMFLRYSNEKNILIDISLGAHISQLTAKYGFF